GGKTTMTKAISNGLLSAILICSASAVTCFAQGKTSSPPAGDTVARPETAAASESTKLPARSTTESRDQQNPLEDPLAETNRQGQTSSPSVSDTVARPEPVVASESTKLPAASTTESKDQQNPLQGPLAETNRHLAPVGNFDVLAESSKPRT